MRGSFRLTHLALQAVHWYSKGVPRRINLICDRVMLMAFVNRCQVADMGMVRAAAREVQGWDC